jgi:hypothetical protein
MCTISVVPDRDGFRLTCNRDERRQRRKALPPAWRTVGPRRAIYPVDPVGPGTWIGVNDSGLAAGLLNRTPRGASPRSRSGLTSRGLIVRRLMEARTLSIAIDLARQLELSRFGLFRVILVEALNALALSSDGDVLALDELDATRPLMLTSSSLGDDLVDPARRRLFEDMMNVPRFEWLRRQDRFHSHQWPTHPAISVLMARADARTVSRTSISVTSEGIRLRYSALAEPHERDIQAA